jgi:hypothetical protein
MIASRKKHPDQVLASLKGRTGIFVVGCSDCATTCATGGEKEVAEMADFLRKNGFAVAGTAVLDVPCDERIGRKFLREHEAAIAGSGAILALSCGSGVNALGRIAGCPVIPGLDSLFLGSVERLGRFNEFCSLCGDCLLSETAAVCTVTRCAKGLVNGPCGGSVLGKCEVDPENECAWVAVFNRDPGAGVFGRPVPARRSHRAGKPHKVKDR